MSDLGDEISSNLMSLALKQRKGSGPAAAANNPIDSTSQSYGDFSGPSEVPNVPSSNHVPVQPDKSGLVDGSYNGAQKALKRRQDKIGETYKAIENNE